MTTTRKQHSQRIVHSSEDPNWRTPQVFYDALNRVFGFELDCAADPDTALHECWFGPGSPYGEDALAIPWNEFEGERPGWCFLNPPYSRKVYRATKNPAMLIENWARKCFVEAQRGCTVVGLFPFSPQTEWYRQWVMGHAIPPRTEFGTWSGFAASEVWRLPHRVSFLRSDGTEADNAGHNVVVVIWRPDPGFVGPWVPAERYWSYR